MTGVVPGTLGFGAQVDKLNRISVSLFNVVPTGRPTYTLLRPNVDLFVRPRIYNDYVHHCAFGTSSESLNREI